MAISVTNIGTGSSAGGTATVGIAVPAGGVPTGALICVASNETSSATAAGSVADTKNTYSTATSGGNASNLAFGGMYYAANASALTSSNTLTYTKNNSSNTGVCSAFYATGVLTTSPLDTAVTAAGSTGATTSPTVTSGTPSLSGELFVAICAYRSSSGFTEDTTHNWATPFNQINVTVTNLGGGNQVNAAATALTFNPTIGASVSCAIMVVAFKPAATASAAVSRGYIFG